MKENPRSSENTPERGQLELLIAQVLRWGVSIACFIALVGGALYLSRHGSEPMPDYSTFSYEAAHPAEYTTLDGILAGIRAMNASSWIQMGVIALLLTPILRVALSLVDFLAKRDWLYAFITSIVLAIIIGNSLSL